ncbi:MAG: radical SAM protein [Mollicutes bacterium]|nr:radical SAM protein [Mollicutes bacterium]
MKNKKIVLTTLVPISHRTSEENLGLGYLKASLEKRGYNVTIIDGWLGELTLDEVYQKIRENEDLLFVGISSYMQNNEDSIKLIKKLKKDDIKVVCGGFGPTFFPEVFLKEGADFVIRGEGEIPIVELANCLEKNLSFERVRGLSWCIGNKYFNNTASMLGDLDIYPFPSRETINQVLSKKSSVNMVTSRGCSGNCDFCSVIAFFKKSQGKKWRTRSIKNIVDEIEILYKQGVNLIKMVDDSFIDGDRNEDWCKAFAEEINKRNIKVRLRGQIRADKVSDAILYHLKRAGFFSFACGIENGSTTALARMNKTATVHDNEKALELFNKHNYIVQMGYILFDRFTTVDELWENYYFLKKHMFTVTKGIFSEMYSAEGTLLNEKLKSSNILMKGNSLSGNNTYQIKDRDASIIYTQLKDWHKSHSYIYDMTIDPLSAPKNISNESIDTLLLIANDLKRKDLEVFKKILIARKKQEDLNIQNLVETSQSFYKAHHDKVKSLYKKENLKYNAECNPFIR